MTSWARFSQHVFDKAVAIKRTLAIRSRFKGFCIKYSHRAITTGFGLELVRDFFLDKKYGGWCGGIIRTPYPELDASVTQSTHYWQLMKLFREVPINESDILVDVGCGKGRVINSWLHLGYGNRIIGVELNHAVAEWTRERLKAYPNVNVITGSILDHTPPHASFFFLYNPFGQGVMEKFKGCLRETSRNRPDLRVLYHNCVHRSVFDNDPDWEVQNLTSRVVEEAVLVRPEVDRDSRRPGLRAERPALTTRKSEVSWRKPGSPTDTEQVARGRITKVARGRITKMASGSPENPLPSGMGCVTQPPSQPYSSRNTARRAAASRDTASMPISRVIERSMGRNCAGDDLRVELHGQVDERGWADRLGNLGGTFFHSFEHAAYESEATNARPIFLEAFRQDILVGMAAGILCTPRLPVLRRVGKEAWFNALPATRDHDAIEQEAVLAAFERRLRGLGVFRIRVAGCDSRNAQGVLADLGYELSGQLRVLSPPLPQCRAELGGPAIRAADEDPSGDEAIPDRSALRQARGRQGPAGSGAGVVASKRDPRQARLRGPRSPVPQLVRDRAGQARDLPSRGKAPRRLTVRDIQRPGLHPDGRLIPGG